MTLNYDFEEEMKEIVSDWVRLHYDDIHNNLLEKDVITDDDIDEMREYVLYEYFNNSPMRDFGAFAKNNIDSEVYDIIDVIHYCNTYYEDNFGDECIINWRHLRDTQYMLNQLGYVWSMNNGDEIMAIFLDMSNNILK